MTDRSRSTFARSSSHVSSSSRAPASDSPSASSSIRPRNRRLISTGDTPDDPPSNRSSGLLSALSPSISRGGSPLPQTTRSAGVSPSRNTATGDLGQFFSESLTQGWSSVQDLTSSLFSGVSGQGKLPDTRGKPSHGPRGRRLSIGGEHKAASPSWGPAPPSAKPGLDDVAAGSLAQRQAALRAARTASVLESHEGVNGGLDVSGKHKRRNSDEAIAAGDRHNDYLVYVHKVQPNDTYAGLILRYKCREDAFRRANGLWSRDSIQTRKWLTIPVDACEVRGRPCEAPSWHNSQSSDVFASTASIDDEGSNQKDSHDNLLTKPINTQSVDTPQAEEEDKPWTHVRWVKIDSIQERVEIGRVARGTMGYFPPRRKRSIRTASSLSTPRQSFDLPNITLGSTEGYSPRRPSSLSSRPQLSGTPTSNRSRMGSDAADGRPSWMKRPGGVGSMGKNTMAPGPDKDVFNSWTRKHIPGLNIEGLPSMSIMGSETAQFGFGKDSDIVENSFEEGRDAITPNRQGTGIDRAAAAVETWLRGALAKRPSTPLRGGRTRAGSDGVSGDAAGDLIELADTASDDGRALGDHSTNVLDNLSLRTSNRSDGGGSIRDRAMTSGLKGGKAD